MNKNFSVGQANELIHDGRVYDLHNCYDFGGITIPGVGSVKLWFSPNPEHGKGQVPVAIEVESLEFLEFSEGFGVGGVESLDEMGYKSPGDRDLDWVAGEDKATSEDHLVFRFGPTTHIRIHGKRMVLTIGTA